MKTYKYPYIPKEYYGAVMYACKLIRKYETFNVATHAAAKAYGVNEDELIKHIRARQAAGQKGIKYRYFILAELARGEAGGCRLVGCKVIRAASLKNAENRFTRTIWEAYDDGDTETYSREIIGNKSGYEKKSDAQNDLKSATTEYVRLKRQLYKLEV